MSSPDPPEPSIFALHRIPNVLLVLVAVALLLQGPVGAFEALWGYTYDLLRAIFGGEDLLLQVLCQTAPLSLAVSAIVFSFRCGWFSLASPVSVIASSALVLAGTWVGGELRSTMSSKLVMMHSETTDAPTAAKMLPVSARGKTRVWLSNQSPLNPIGKSAESESDSASDTISVAQAFAILSDFQTVATDGSHHRWNQPVPRIELIPESGASGGLVAKAVNQLLGYFVIYRPRLFLAAILLGGYIGWSWQPYFEALRSWVRNRIKRPVSASH